MEQNEPTKIGELTKASDSPPIQEYFEVARSYVETLPEKLKSFFADYKPLLLFLLLIISAWIAVQFTIAILGAIDGVPLLEPISELVGLGYIGWFIYRYLLWKDTRKELMDTFNSLKSKFVDGGSGN